MKPRMKTPRHDEAIRPQRGLVWTGFSSFILVVLSNLAIEVWDGGYEVAGPDEDCFFATWETYLGSLRMSLRSRARFTSAGDRPRFMQTRRSLVASSFLPSTASVCTFMNWDSTSVAPRFSAFAMSVAAEAASPILA